MKTKTKIAVALSGGVDSSLVAYLLQQQGYEVVAITMVLNENDDVSSAKKVTDFLNIPHVVIDMKEDFNNEIIDYFVNSYEKGLTPSPCIVCNRKIKFGKLLEIAKNMDCRFMATGHYAKIKNNNELHKADNPKDQSYFLFNIKYEDLEYIKFPLGEYTKEEVREMAKKANLPTHNKKDSQDICFIKGDYKDFLKGKIENPIGSFVKKDGSIIGKHEGIANYTIGQRKGLKLGGFVNPLFVLDIDIKGKNIVVGEQSELLKTKLKIENVNWLVPDINQMPFQAMVKLRSRQKEVMATIIPINTGAEIELHEPFAGIAPGQGACFYDGTKVIGGGFITNDY